jgi:hypothetical protein
VPETKEDMEYRETNEKTELKELRSSKEHF